MLNYSAIYIYYDSRSLCGREFFFGNFSFSERRRREVKNERCEGGTVSWGGIKGHCIVIYFSFHSDCWAWKTKKHVGFLGCCLCCWVEREKTIWWKVHEGFLFRFFWKSKSQWPHLNYFFCVQVEIAFINILICISFLIATAMCSAGRWVSELMNFSTFAMDSTRNSRTQPPNSTFNECNERLVGVWDEMREGKVIRIISASVAFALHNLSGTKKMQIESRASTRPPLRDKTSLRLK